MSPRTAESARGPLARLGAERLAWLAALPSIGYLAAFLWVALSRLRYPAEVEWMEGGMLAHAARLAEGEAIYAPPSLDFVPFFYTPGYPALVYALSELTGGISFTLGRGVSLGATLGLMWLIYSALRRQAPLPYALLGVGLYAGFFRTAGAFYDMARPDSLAALLTGGVIYLGYFGKGHRAAAAAAALMCAAFLTKQTASVFYPAVGLYWLTRAPRPALTFWGLTAALSVGSVYALNEATHGAFWGYIFEGHQGHLFYWKNILVRYWRDTLYLAPFALIAPLLWWSHASPLRWPPRLLLGLWLYAYLQRATTLNYAPHMYYQELWYEDLWGRWALLVPPALIALLAAAHRWRAPRPTLNMSGYWLWVFTAAAGASGLNHSTQWAYSNCFMPLALGVSLSAPLMLRDLWGGSRAPQLLLCALWVQWGAWLYSPTAQVPSEVDLRALSALRARLAEVQGPLFTPASPLINHLEGRGAVHTHQMGIQDVAYRGGVSSGPARLALAARLPRPDAPPPPPPLTDPLTPLTPTPWSAALTAEQARTPWLEGGYFEAERLLYLSRDALRAKTGFLTRPEALWLPRHSQGARWIEGAAGGVSANFEPLKPATPASTWESLGWSAEGEAFGRTPRRLLMGGREGDYGASSVGEGRGGLKALGALTARLAPPPATPSSQRLALTLLTAIVGPSGEARGARVELFDASGRRVAQAAPRGHLPHRLTLWLPRPPLAPLTLRVVDDDPERGFWVDDLRWQGALDGGG